MLAWRISKTTIISIGALEKALAELCGMCHLWYGKIIDDNYYLIEYNNPDEWGNDNPCSFKFPIVGNLKNLQQNDLESLVLIDGLVARNVESSEYTYSDFDDTYTYTDEEGDWSATMDPLFDIMDRAINHKISLNPNEGK